LPKSNLLPWWGWLLIVGGGSIFGAIIGVTIQYLWKRRYGLFSERESLISRT